MSESVTCCEQPEIDFVVLDRIIQEEYGGRREAMIMMMQAIQRQYRYLPEEALIYLSLSIGVPLTKIYEVATFYASFSLIPKGKHILHVCTGTACHLRGSGGMVQHVAQKLGIEPGQTTPDMKITLETVNCLGACAMAPIVVLDETYHPQSTVGLINELIDPILAE
ncbi:MAG: NAD(P)H-dependent oxidoreductase subunit E [Thermodesulfobacteriota bacterium]